MAKPTPDRYRPGIVPDTPEALIPFLYDELYRIAIALYDHVVGLIVGQANLVVAVTPTPVWAQLLVGSPASVDLPGGGWHEAGGYWICPENGFYNISLNSIVAPFGAGNKIYNVVLQVNIADTEGAPNDSLMRMVDSGDDNLELGANVSFGAQLKQGNELTFWIQSQHDQFSGNLSVDSYLSIGQASAE